MNIFLKSIRTDIFVYILLIIFGFLFLFHLDYTTLAPWDEGWYASIAREMVKTGDIFHMIWNGLPYYDHPPMGFWLMALSYKIFGINEFATRLPSAILGLFSIFLIYKSGMLMFKRRSIGFAAALIMGTCVWYVLRVRSGNLDAIFIFFYILTVFFSLKSSRNFRWFPLVGLAFAGLLLSKTLVGASAAILILFLNFRQFLRPRNWLYIVLSLILFCILALPWYLVNSASYPDFIHHHFFVIGMREKTATSYFHLTWQQPLFYLHMGVRKWYYLWLISTVYLVWKLIFHIAVLGYNWHGKKRKKEISYKAFGGPPDVVQHEVKMIFFLFIWNIVVLYPFLTSEHTELWHLIPIYLPIAFITAFGLYEIVTLCLSILKRISPFHNHGIMKSIAPSIGSLLYLLLVMSISLTQFKTFYNEVFTNTKFIPDDVDVSRKVSMYNKKIFLDDDYLPLAVFYANKNIQQLAYYKEDRKTLLTLFKSDETDFVVITRNWAVENLKKEAIPYKILYKNNSFSIVSR